MQDSVQPEVTNILSTSYPRNARGGASLTTLFFVFYIVARNTCHLPALAYGLDRTWAIPV